jgi:hypothetical protein
MRPSARPRTLAFLAACTLTLAAGCSGGGDDGLEDVDPAALAIMVLPPEELADSAKGLDIDGELSGVSSPDDAASASVDPADTPGDIRQTGRRAGYDLHLVDLDLGSLQGKAGPVETASGVELFATPEQAKAYRTDVLGAYGRFVGKEISPAVRLVRAEPEDVDVGSEATLVRSTLTGDGFVVHSTSVDFRVDRVVGTVLLSRADDRDVSDEAVRLAQALEHRIRDAAAGSLDDTPVQIDGARRAAPAKAPKGAQDLDRYALATADLPAGTFVDDEEYAGEQDGLRFRRSFVVGLRKIGGSQVASLESAVVRTAGPRAALSGVVQLALVLSGPQGPAFFTQVYEQGGRFRPRDVRVAVVQVPAMPTGFIAFVRFASPLGKVESALGVVAVGRHVGRITVVAPAGRLKPADVARLLYAQARRMSR